MDPSAAAPPTPGFQLLPFAAGPVVGDGSCGPQRFRLRGALFRQGGHLSLEYRLEGPIGELLLPDPSPAPERRDGLWQHTCLEAFLAPEDSEEAYWELNLSPCGDWNVYGLSGYRRGLRPETLSGPPSLERHRSGGQGEDRIVFTARWPLPPPLVGAPLRIGITAVLEDLRGDLSYWALAHTGPEPDFHRCDSFLLRL
ncbi:MAG: DOMON-like domain-containing protein [Synechococcus sp.]